MRLIYVLLAGLVMATVGATSLRTVMLTGAEVVARPPLSVATALSR